MSRNREASYKWLLFVLLATFVPLPFYAPVVGAVPSSYLLIVIQGMPILLTPFAILVLGQALVYGIALYVPAIYLARYLHRGADGTLKWLLLVLLMADLVLFFFGPALGAGSESLFARYQELFG